MKTLKIIHSLQIPDNFTEQEISTLVELSLDELYYHIDDNYSEGMLESLITEITIEGKP